MESVANTRPCLLEHWRSGRLSLGVWCSLAEPRAAEVLARQDFDWACIDMQHGYTTHATLPSMIDAITNAGKPSIVRVSWNTPADIMWALDVGAQGILVPMVESAADARKAVEACRYPPDGSRSFGCLRSGFDPAITEAMDVNRQVACVVMVETAAAANDVASIAEVPGVDAVFVGPSDLALAFGLTPGADARNSSEFMQAMERIAHVAIAHNKPVGVYAGSPELVWRWADMGYQFMTLESDLGLLGSAAQPALAAAREGSSKS